MKPTSVKDIRELLQRNGFSPLKKFGQNFLTDENITQKIAQAAVPAGGNVFEIGTGLGALTVQLAARARQVASVEIDKGLLSLHPEIFAGKDNVHVMEGDILQTNLQAVDSAYFNGEAFSVCGNLPYYITSKILIHIVEADAPIDRVTVMVQKEVAERLIAGPGDTQYGALTASLAYYGNVQALFTVSKNCFYPAPDVDSAVIQLDLSGARLDADRQSYVRTVRGAFAMRRKTIYNNLKQLAGAEQVQTALERVGISPETRAQDVLPEQFAQLANALFTQ